MRVLVAGGAGFLGSHLCEKLLNSGHEVLAVDNYYTGARENVKHLIANPRFELMRHDVTFPLFVEVDAIMNLACPASPIHYQKSPVQTIKTSILGSINLLGLAKRTGARIFQASTSEVYGDPLTSPQVEEDWGNVNPIGIRSCYDEGKRAAETLFADYRRQYEMDTRIVRIFNTYGPRMNLRDGRVVSNFIHQALTGHALTIYGDGNQTRSFCYVSDLIEAFKLVIESEVPIPGPINLGNPTEFTMNELANEVLKATGSKVGIEYRELPGDDPRQRRPDVSKAKTILGWEPRIDLKDGLKLTVEDFTRRIKQEI